MSHKKCKGSDFVGAFASYYDGTPSLLLSVYINDAAWGS